MTTISVSLDEMDDSHSVHTDALNDNNTENKHKKHVKRKAKNTSSNNTTTTTTNTKKRNEEKKGAGKSSSKGRVFRVLKHKRRYCREPGCDKIVKSQGLCQRHGAKPKKCSVVECIKQAQGSYNGMCKSHFRMYNKTGPPASNAQQSNSKHSTEIHRPRISQFCEPIVSVAEDDETVARTMSDGTEEIVLDIVTSSGNGMWDATMFGSTEALAEDIAILQSSTDRNGQQQSSSYPSTSTQRTGTVSPHEHFIEKPQRVVRWSTEDTFTNFDDNNGTSRTTLVRASVKNELYSMTSNSEINFVQQRPVAISKRNFSTDTNFSVDVALIDQDLDCEHAFDEYDIETKMESVNSRSMVHASPDVPYSVS